MKNYIAYAIVKENTHELCMNFNDDDGEMFEIFPTYEDAEYARQIWKANKIEVDILPIQFELF